MIKTVPKYLYFWFVLKLGIDELLKDTNK